MNARQIDRIVKARTYRTLVHQFPPRIVRNRRDFDVICRVIEKLMSINSPTEDQLEFLEILSTLATNYEAIENPPETVSLSDLLAHLIEARETTKAELARQANVSASTISDVLAGRRAISKANIKRLAKFFHVSPTLFLEATGPREKDAA